MMEPSTRRLLDAGSMGFGLGLVFSAVVLPGADGFQLLLLVAGAVIAIVGAVALNKGQAKPRDEIPEANK